MPRPEDDQEITNEDELASLEGEEEALTGGDPNAGQSQDDDDGFELEEKFQADSTEESLRKVHQSYKELESKLGSMASERDYYKQRDTEIRSRLDSLEQRHDTQTQASLKDQFKERLKEDPEAALEWFAEKTEERFSSMPRESEQRYQQQRTRDYYEHLKANDKDFVDLEDDIAQFIQTEGPKVFDPNKAMTPEALKFAYDTVKARNMDRFIQREVKRRASVKADKRRNVSESGASRSSSSNDKPWTRSMEELEAAIAAESGED